MGAATAAATAAAASSSKEEVPLQRTASHAHVPHLSMPEFAALKSAERKLLWRVLLLNIALMFVNYLDRTNLSFAHVQLGTDIGLDDATYGLGAGVFFATYASMQVPANLMMSRIGGPIWLASIALAWGVVATSFCLIRNQATFLALRCLLGVFEAGALPGMWAYLSNFYSKQRLTIPMGYLMGALIVSQAVGAPIAAGLMSLDGHAGLRGWQWLFLVEGLLAVVVAVAWFWMPADIDAVKCLKPEERAALHASMRHHHKPASDVRAILAGALRNPAVWIAGAGIKFFRDIAFFGLIYWLPRIIEVMLKQGNGHATGLNRGTLAVLLSTIPFVASAITQFFTCWHSQRKNERRFHLAVFWGLGVVCMALLPLTEMRGVHAASFVLLVLATVGVFGVEGISVSYYLALMGGEKGVGIAVINTLGALGGFAGPYIIGNLTQASGNFYGAMWLLSGCLAVAAINAALVSEEWAARFSLKSSSHHHHHHAHHAGDAAASGRVPSTPVPLADALDVTGLAALMDDSSSSCSSVSASASAAAACQDIEMGGGAALTAAAAAADAKDAARAPARK